MKKIPDAKIREVIRLRDKGLKQPEIATYAKISVGSVNRIIKDYKVAAPAPALSASADEPPELIPEGVDVAIVDKWIPKVEKMLAQAEAAKDMSAASSLLSRLTSLLEHKRKAAPLPKEDPNADPDMIAAKERARAEFHRLIDHNLITRVRGA
jgi:hypothetical protein